MSRRSNFRSLICASRSRLLGEIRGSQLVELAIGLPLLVIMAVAVSQFAGAFNLKQILNNGARDGARVAANEFSDYGTLSNCTSGSCVAAVAETMSNYLQNASVRPQCTFSTTGNSSGTFAWTFNSSSGGSCSLASIKVERAFPIVSGSRTITGTRVTLTYPNQYTVGGLFSFLVPGSTTNLPTSLTSDATMPNIN
jgi:Flp pilus assembly protein TadG